MFSDADAAALYDLLNPWNPGRSPGDRFYHKLVMAADSVLDVGCGTGAMLACARDHGHRGRLTGLDPDRAALDRARRRAGIEWAEGTAADARWKGDFDLATMTGHAFQCLRTDHDLHTSLTAIHAALRTGGRFVFETRHPQARAWLIEAQYGDWHCEPISTTSREIITIARTKVPACPGPAPSARPRLPGHNLTIPLPWAESLAARDGLDIASGRD